MKICAELPHGMYITEMQLVLVKGLRSLLHMFLDTFFIQKSFALQYRGQKEKNWRLHVFLYQFNRTSAGTVVLPAVVMG